MLVGVIASSWPPVAACSPSVVPMMRAVLVGESQRMADTFVAEKVNRTASSATGFSGLTTDIEKGSPLTVPQKVRGSVAVPPYQNRCSNCVTARG